MFFRFVARRSMSSQRRLNPLGIQMISSSLQKKLFPSEPIYSKTNVDKSRKHLKEFGLDLSKNEILDDIEFELPPLKNSDLNEHFRLIADEQSAPYVKLIRQMLKPQIPQQPKSWANRKGWTKFVE